MHTLFRAGLWRLITVLCAAVALSGCAATGPVQSPPSPEGPSASVPEARTPPSAKSADLARYYAIVQRDQLTRGLLRQDGGGPDTPFTPDQLTRNFEKIVFYEEYRRSGGQTLAGDGTSGKLSRWKGPVRIGSEFGASVPPEMRVIDADNVARFTRRLGALTGHPISTARNNPNFHVVFAGEDDSAFVQDRLRSVIPSISDADLQFFSTLPRSVYCLVIAVASERSPHHYDRAVALIRAEQPRLMREACIHEELAQGLGLPNDSPEARPSIFNDDDEFALLTNHDEFLLRMLYDPRLKAGMTAEEARPITRIISRELMGQVL